MQSPNVVLLQNNPQIARSLAAALSGSFHSIHVAHSLQELRDRMAKHRSRVAIVDMEMASINDLAKLAREFPGTSILCNHRLADEKMWADALKAGVSDVFASSDTGAIVNAARRDETTALSAAA